MRHFILILLCAICGLSLNSCKDDETIDPGWGDSPAPMPAYGYLWDGGRISGISLYGIPKASYLFEAWQNFDKKPKKFTSYSNVILILEINSPYSKYETDETDDKEEMNSIKMIENEYEKERGGFIFENYMKNFFAPWTHIYTAYVNGEVSIVCDKKLWGKTPGTNLIEHFNNINLEGCVPVGIENPKMLYNFNDEKPSNLSKILVNEGWLLPSYILNFATEPTEKYSELTFHITMPMTLEHIRDYAVAKYKGEETGPIFTNHVFETDCKILFE